MKKWRKRFHLFMVFFWTLMIIPTVIWWKESVLWIALLSLYANIETSFSALEASEE